MDKIIKLDKKHIEQLAIIDFESEHQGDREMNISIFEMKKGIQNRFKEGHEIFFWI